MFLIVGLVVLVLFSINEYYIKYPLLPLRTLSNESFFLLSSISMGWISFAIWLKYMWVFQGSLRESFVKQRTICANEREWYLRCHCKCLSHGNGIPLSNHVKLNACLCSSKHIILYDANKPDLLESNFLFNSHRNENFSA